MRTLLLVGIAGFAAWHADSALANHYDESRVERRVTIINGTVPQDEVVYVSSDDRVPTEYDYRGRWQGEWNGRWIDGDPRAYEGTYEGTYEPGHDARGAPYAAPTRVRERSTTRSRNSARREDARRNDVRHYSDAEMARMCRPDNGLGGAAIGGVVGGVVGNRVAGRGNRTAGTLLGAGAGALAGAVIDRSEDRRACDAWLRSRPVEYRSSNEGYSAGYGYPVAGYPVAYRSNGVRYRSAAADGITRGWVLPGSDRVFTSEELSDLCVTGARNVATDSGLCDTWASETSGYAATTGYVAGGETAYATGGVTYTQPMLVGYSAPVIIEETETWYETVAVPAARPAVRRSTPVRRTAARRAPAPRATARCVCR